MSCKQSFKPSSPATRLGRKLGLVSHVRCESLTKVVAKLTNHRSSLPHPELLNHILKMSSMEMECSALSTAERNTLLASEMGKRLQTPCFEQGLKALFVIHTFMTKGHESFRQALAGDPSLLYLDRASDHMWLLCPTARKFKAYIANYGSYLNDLSNFFALAAPYDLYAKPTITTKTTNSSSPGESDATEEKTTITTTPSKFHLSQARTALSQLELHGLMSSALALFKSASALTPDEAIASHPVSREMAKLVYSDIKILYVFLTEYFYNNAKHKLQGKVEDMERGLALYEAYEVACAEVSVFFATAASFNIITATPKLKPVPRTLIDKLVTIVKNAKASGLEQVNWEEEMDPHSVEHDTLENVLATSETATERSEDTVGSPGGSVHTPSTEAAPAKQGAAGTPGSRGTSANFNFEDDSLADLRTTYYAEGNGEAPSGSSTGTLDGKDLEDEPEDIKALLREAVAPALMVAASENSASAARRFHLLRDDVLGKGGFGTVFKAWDNHEGMYAAVKEIVIDTKRTNVQELFGEFRTATTVSHENIVKTLMFSLSDTTGSIFMEWLPAGSLHQVLAQTKSPFGEHLVRRYVRDALRGLRYLHQRGIVHRDIKLSNMLLSVGGMVKLTDFGSSKQVIVDTSMKTDHIVGTVPYMAPEAVRGTYSTASDIWAIGCSIVEMLTAKHPWAERGEGDQIAMIFHIGSLQSPNHMPSYGPEDAVSDELRSFLEMCFVFDYKNRPSAEKLLEHPWLMMGEE